MGERENAFELVPYTELTDAELAETLNKVELIRRSNNGITVVGYWHRSEDEVSIYVHDARVEESAEFTVPNDEVMNYFNHPFSHPDADLRTYKQSENNE